MFNGGGKSLAQERHDTGQRIWAIFDGKSSNGLLHDDDTNTDGVYQHTWESVRSTDFNNSTDITWKARGHVYKNLEDISGHIHVNGKPVFPGLHFTAPPSNDDDELGKLELSPREYRILMNPSGTQDVYFKIKGVEAGSFIWVEAVTNSTTLTDAYGLNFTVVKYDDNSVTATRIDRGTADSKELEKHMFCYYVSTAGDYYVKPSRACYLYYVAVLNHPSPVIDFETASQSKNTTMWGEMTNSYHGPYSNRATITVYNSTSNDNSVISQLVYSSDDETVATVDANGNTTCQGLGSAKIYATLPAGSTFSYGNNKYTLEHDCSEYFRIDVFDKRVVTSAGISKDNTQNLWSTVPINRIHYNPYDSEFSSSSTYEDKNAGDYIRLYLGGWKYQTKSTDTKYPQSESALKSMYPYIDGKNITGYTNGSGDTKYDYWAAAKDYNVGNELPIDYQSQPLDGYDIYYLGKENGKNEFLYNEKLLAGDYVLDFKERTPELNNYPDDNILSEEEKTNHNAEVQGRGNPFTVPCFGSFIKIEPERNGQVTLYILQNGNLEFDSDNNNHLLGRLGWRPVFIVDEAGNRLSENEDKGNVKAITKQRTMVSSNDETSDVYDPTDKTKLIYKEPDGTFTTTPTNQATLATYVDVMKNYHDTSTKEWIYKRHESVYNKHWGRRGTVETIIPPSETGDGWVAMTKGYVKYQFDVKAGKSYYVFSNKSAIGFCGATFLPDAAPSGSATLNENSSEDEVAKILGSNESVTLGSVTVNHQFHAGWNSICLPFSLTESKMREIFGKDNKEDYEVIMYNGSTETSKTGENGVKYDKVHFFHHVYQDIIAGYPYMIYIPAGAAVLSNNTNSTINKNRFTIKNVTIENVKRPTITRSSQYMPVGSGFENHKDANDGDINEDFTFTGVYKPTLVARGSYLVVENGISLYDAVTMPGYRAYLHPSYKDKAATEEVKRISVTNLDEVTSAWDEVTPIKSILTDEMPENTFAAPSDVYSVSGQLIRKGSTSLEGLPKGTYIVNGKKYLVK